MHVERYQTYQLSGLLHVGALEAGDDRGTQVHALHDTDQTLSNGIAPDNASEDVDEDGSHLRVASDQVKRLLDRLGCGATSDVEEVRGAASIEFDDVHGGHG